MPLQTLLQSSTLATLNHPYDAQALWHDLSTRSPLLDPRKRPVYTFNDRYKHVLEHPPGDARRRLQRVGWVEPTLVEPGEIRKNPRCSGLVYLKCFHGYLPQDTLKRQFFAVIVDDRDHRLKQSVVTIIPLSREKDVENLRKEGRLWP